MYLAMSILLSLSRKGGATDDAQRNEDDDGYHVTLKQRDALSCRVAQLVGATAHRAG